MTSEELKALQEYVKVVATENSIVLVQIPEDKLEELSRSLTHLNNTFGPRFNIIFVGCPMNVKLTVIPAHSEVKLENELQS